MTRTETDLRAMYVDLADEATDAMLLSNLVELSGALHLPSGRQSPRPGNRSRRTVAVGLVAAVAIIAAILAPIGFRGIGQTPAAADPIAVLRQAASHARTQPDVTPRPDQFYYVKVDGSELWLSIDGTHDGLQVAPGSGPVSRPGCRTGLAQEPGNYAGTRAQHCTPDPAYVPDAPTTAAGMLSFLQSRYGAAGVNGIGKGAYDLLQYHYLHPAARAALFDALTQLPTLRTVRTAPYAGRATIGVTWSTTGPDNIPALGQKSDTLVFDLSSHAFIAIRTKGIMGEQGGAAASTLSAIVDRVGQRP